MKTLFGLVIAVCVVALGSPAFALFVNGGFETGNYTGWTVTYGRVDGSATPANPNWTSYRADQPLASIVTATTFPDAYQSLDVNPYNDTYMAKINNIVDNYHATKLSQTDTLTAADLTKTVYVNWGVMLVDPNHTDGQNPYFSIKVLINGIPVNSFAANANQTNLNGVPISPWVLAGDDSAGSTTGSRLFYNHGTYSYDLSGYAAGNTIGIEIFVAGCDLGGHGAYAFLDGIGTEYDSPSNVPIPPTLYLLGACRTFAVQYSG